MRANFQLLWGALAFYQGICLPFMTKKSILCLAITLVILELNPKLLKEKTSNKVTQENLFDIN